MTLSRRRRDAKQTRKGVLRQMKRLLRTLGEHARRHRDRLATDYAQTRLSECQAQRIITRIQQRAPAEWRQFEAGVDTRTSSI